MHGGIHVRITEDRFLLASEGLQDLRERLLRTRLPPIASWAEHPVGGHFPAVAEPELFIRSLRDAFHSAR